MLAIPNNPIFKIFSKHCREKISSIITIKEISLSLEESQTAKQTWQKENVNSPITLQFSNVINFFPLLDLIIKMMVNRLFKRQLLPFEFSQSSIPLEAQHLLPIPLDFPYHS